MDAEDERNARRLRLVDERLDAVVEQVDAVDTLMHAMKRVSRFVRLMWRGFVWTKRVEYFECRR